MDKHIRLLRKEEFLEKHFDKENAERVVSWLVAAKDRKPVALVGAGFTLNALTKGGTYATRKQAPLWRDLLEPLADHLGVSASDYDVPHLLELYVEAFGVGKLRDQLRDAVMDDDLQPGGPHDALASYPFEAIVTTNCLDTLLDRACKGGFRPVVTDSDLSASSPAGLRDLIYLHGHRNQPDTWVMTRSQYEDFERSRPVMLSRVRQLLAQHPWVILGFGLADPNLHAIVRLLGSEMRGHQPLSLALMREPPTAAERQHWRRLGIEIVSPSGLSRTGERSFQNFLSWVLPKLATTYSPNSHAAQEYVARGASPEEKLKRFRGVYSGFVSSLLLGREVIFTEWKNQLISLLPQAEREQAEMAARRASEAMFSDHTPSPKTELGGEVPRKVVHHERVRLKDSVFEGLDRSSEYRQLESFVEIQCLSRLLSRVSHGELARHFMWGLERALFEGADDRLPWEVIAVRLAARAGWNDAGGRLEALFFLALESARRYGRRETEELLKVEAAELGLQVPSEAEIDTSQQHLHAAKNACKSFLDGEFESAARGFEQASKCAADRDLVFEAWAYTVGQSGALMRLEWKTPKLSEELALQKQVCRERLDRLSEHPLVARWLRRADERVLLVHEEVLVRSQESSHYRVTGGWGRRYGGAGHSLWRSFRDLETIHAPPLLQQKYFRPLLPLLDTEWLETVVRTVREAGAWTKGMLARPVASLEERRSRDQRFTGLILGKPAESTTRTELAALLECTIELSSVFSDSEIDAVMEWVVGVAKRIEHRSIDTAWDSRSVIADCWRAFLSAARWSQPSDTFSWMNRLIEAFPDVSWSQADAVRVISELPWERWKPLSAHDAQRFVGLLARLLELESNENRPHVGIITDAMFGVLQILQAVPSAQKFDVPLLSEWRELVAEEKKRSGGLIAARRAGFFLERDFRLGVSDLPRAESGLLNEWFGSEVADSSRLDWSEEKWITLVRVINESGGSTGELADEIRKILRMEDLPRIYGQNPHSSFGATALLCLGMKFFPELRGEIGNFLLQILESAPESLRYLSTSLAKGCWEEGSWAKLFELLASACGGGMSTVEDPGLPTRRQLAVLSLFGDLQNSSVRADCPELWQILRSCAFASINDDRSLIANRASFSVVNIAREIEGGEAALFAAAIIRIAQDHRPVVRSAISAGAPELSLKAKSAEVRKAATTSLEIVSADDNAQVQAILRSAQRALEKDCGGAGSGN